MERGHVEGECVRKVLDGPTFYHRVAVSPYRVSNIFKRLSIAKKRATIHKNSRSRRLKQSKLL